MPIYEYECAACGQVVEATQRMSDPPLDRCPVCGGGPVSKLISRTSFQLKGTGWYATDYKKSDSKPSAKAETAAAPASPAKTETSTPAGPAKAEPVSAKKPGGSDS